MSKVENNNNKKEIIFVPVWKDENIIKEFRQECEHKKWKRKIQKKAEIYKIFLYNKKEYRRKMDCLHKKRQTEKIRFFFKEIFSF